MVLIDCMSLLTYCQGMNLLSIYMRHMFYARDSKIDMQCVSNIQYSNDTGLESI